MSGFGRPVAVFAASLLYWLAGGSAGSAQPATPENKYNELLLHMSSQQQAEKLASFLGLWCIGTKPFYMGTTKTGQAKGYAYWNITCAGGQPYLIQLPPDGRGQALECKTFNEAAKAQGRECYKSF
jgi:hypothetical protein